MGDVAFVFGWSPEVMDRMDVTELLGWHGEAVRIHNAVNGTKDG
ncbi:GpE family phage tail protein [Sphingosinicella sp. CPCC 101087]|nr:GpE family phage tail protein [Sphingosinicella sp. CPCC 101087]